MSNLTHQQRLEKAHITLMNNKTFCRLTGLMLMGKSEISAVVPTAATDGRNKWYNPGFIDALTEPEFNFVVAHENFHVMLRHLVTWKHLNDIDPPKANMACDYVINLMIRDLALADNDKNPVCVPPAGALIDDKYAGMDAGQVFRLLQDEGTLDGGGGDSESGDSSSTGAGGEPLDDHMWDAARAMTPEEQDALEREIDQAIRQGELLAGSRGGASTRALGKLTEPKIDWREQLREFISEVVAGKDNSTWARPNRRWLHRGMYMPSTYTESVGEIVIGIDTSASVSMDDVTKMMSEVVGITRQVTPDKVTLLYWDAEVAGEEVYLPGEYERMADVTKPAGGGGTLPQCVADHIKDTTPELVIMLTDGYVWSWPTFNVPVLWVMTTDVVAPTGQTIKLT